MPFEGGPVIRLTSGPADEDTPRWLGRGERLVYLGDNGARKELMLLNRNGASEFLTVTNVAVENYVDAWKLLGAQPSSIDGHTVLFSRLTEDGRISVWEIDVRIRQEREHSHPPAACDDLQASPSPNGNAMP
jgi:hypothetical protein